MLDFITNPLADVWHLIGNIFQFFAVIIVLFIVGIIVAIPLGMKLFAVAFARTLVVETAKIVEGISSNANTQHAIKTISNEINQLKRGDR